MNNDMTQNLHLQPLHSSFLGQWKQQLTAEHKQREALEMRCTDVAEQLNSSDYFYSMVESLNDRSQELLRPRKFTKLVHA